MTTVSLMASLKEGLDELSLQKCYGKVTVIWEIVHFTHYIFD